MDKTILAIPKNSRDEIRLTLGQFEGHDLCNIRVWSGVEGETKRPTPKGIAYKISLLPEVIAGLQEAERQAREGGLL